MDQTLTPRPARVGLIGAGAVARFHAQALRRLPGVTLVAVCDPVRSRAVALRDEFEIPDVFESIEEMSLRATLDAVHVLVPVSGHAATAVSCLARGWHVFVEKPLATSPDECRQIGAAAQRAGRFAGVNHNLTFLPCVLRLIRDIQARRFGRLENVHTSFSVPMPQLSAGQYGHWIFTEPGNMILEMGPHPLSIIVRLMGPVQAAETVASGRRILANGSVVFDTWQALLTCERGTAQCYLSLAGGLPERWAYVLGQDGAAMLDLQRNTYSFIAKSRFAPPVDDLLTAVHRSRSHLAGGWRNFSQYAAGLLGFRDTTDIFSAGMRNSIAAFYEAIRAGRQPPAGMAEASAVVDACLAISGPVHQGARPHVPA